MDDSGSPNPVVRLLGIGLTISALLGFSTMKLGVWSEFGIEMLTPLSVLSIMVLLAVVAVLASWIPARVGQPRSIRWRRSGVSEVKRAVPFVLLAVLACRTTPAPVSPPQQSDARNLTGLWEIQIGDGWFPLPFLRGKSSNVLSGSRLTLAPERGGDSVAITVALDTVRGVVRFPINDPDPMAPTEAALPARAFFRSDGQAVVWISLDSRCLDCKDVELLGEMDGRTITGTYTRTFDTPPAGGRRDPTRPRGDAYRTRFTMRRIAP